MIEAWIGGGLGLVVALCLAALWRARGWGDAPVGAERARKLQRAAVPAVGGFALLAAWGLQAWLAAPEIELGLLPAGELALWDRLTVEGAWSDALWLPWSVGLPLFIAFVAGWADDSKPGGLSARDQVLLQVIALLNLTLHLPVADFLAGRELHLGSASVAPSILVVLWLVPWGVFAMNAVNTFDNADGAVCGVLGVGLFLAGSPLAPAVLLFSLPNLLLRRRAGAGEADPWAYLGDAGSQLVGMAVVITPSAWPALTLPALDLSRVAVARLAAGQRPWVGDRRHLAHRLERRGLGPLPVVLVLLLVSGPVLLLPLGWGIPGTSLLFALACFATRNVGEP